MFEFCFPVWGLAGSDCGLWGRLWDRLWDRLRTLGGLWADFGPKVRPKSAVRPKVYPKVRSPWYGLWDGLRTLGGFWAQSGSARLK